MAKAAKTAIKTKDWYSVLHYLRLCRPIISITQLVHLRAEAYSGIGFDDYASALFEMAADLDPADGPLGSFAI